VTLFGMVSAHCAKFRRFEHEDRSINAIHDDQPSPDISHNLDASGYNVVISSRKDLLILNECMPYYGIGATGCRVIVMNCYEIAIFT